MKTNYKLALALLYFLQLMIVFRESVAEAYKHAFDAIQGRVETIGADVAEQAPATGSGRKMPSGEPALIIESGMRAAQSTFVLGHIIADGRDQEEVHHDHHDHPETEDNVKKLRRRSRYERLIANLFPEFQRLSAPAQTEIVPVMTMLRLISYPSPA